MAGTNNPYDNIINLAPSNNTGPSSTPSLNPYDSVLEQENNVLDEQLNLVLRQASQVDPVNQAEVQRISRETGIPQDLVGRNQDEILREWGARRARTAEIARNNPIVARQLTDRDFASIAWDDIPNLTNTEALVNFFRTLPEDAASGYNRGVNTNEMGYIGHRAQIGTATEEDLARFRELQEIDRETGRLGFIGNTTTILGQMLDSQLDPVVTGLYTGTAYAGAVAIAGQLGPQVAFPEEVATLPIGFGRGFYVGYMAKNTEQAYRIEAGHSYMDMIEAGVDRRTAQYASTGVGLTNAALNFVGLSMVASPIKSALTRAMTERVAANLTRPGMRSAMTAFGINYTRAVAGETTTEVAQELVTLFGTEVAKSFADGEFEYLMNTPEGRNQIAETVVETMRVVGQGMSVLALPGASFNLTMDIRAARQAKRDQQFIQDLGFLADQSQVQSRNPDAYQQFLAAQTNGTPVENLYIDAEQLSLVLEQQGITPEQLEQAIPGVSEQLVEAQATGGDVIIPTSVYGAKIAGTKAGAAMTEHLRVSVDAMSAKEAIEFQGKQQEMMQEAQRTLAEKMETNKEFNAQAATVRKTILDMVKQTGQYSEKVASTYADFVRDFVVINAEKMNMSPQAFYERYMYRITGQMQGQQAMQDQDILASEGFVNQATNEVIPTSKPFQDWFGASTMVDEQGAPKVLYHGTVDSIDAFDLDHPNRKDSGWLGTGVYLTDSSLMGGMYANQKARSMSPKGQQVMPLYARLENPYYATAEEKQQIRAGGRKAADEFTERLKAEGYDGVILQVAPDAQEVVVFEPSAVKSVFNDGTWSRESSQILAQGVLNQRAAPVVEGQSMVEGNKAGLMPHLRVTAQVEIPKGKKPLFAQETKNSTAPRQIAAIDEVLARHPNATSSPEAWTAMMADALATTEVPAPPYAFIENINGTGSFDLLSTLSPGQIQDADQGFANGAAFRDDYINGRISIQDTGRLFLWSFLSRGVSPYTQESLFIDSFYGIDEWITAAAEGTLESRIDEYKAWAATTAPKGSGQPGAGATHNLNAFGSTFLVKMSQDAGDGTGRSRLQVLHDMMSDPNSTGQAVRRKFLEMGEGVGIDNKVVSFTLLVAGFTDVMVLDRVQIRELWNDGRFDGINLYDGYKDEGKPVAGSAISNLTYGARGLLVYEAIERGLQQKIDLIYTALERPEAASPGRYHWETWVASSNQEASHATIDAIMEAARGAPNALEGVTAKEGEYGAYAYGARYGRNGNGVPYFLYSVPGVSDYRFTVPQFREFLNGIKVAGNKIIPPKFKVTQSGNQPWFFREGVSLDNLAALAEQIGEKYVADTISTKDANAGIDQPVANRLATDKTIDGDAFNQQAREPGSDLVYNPDGTVTVYHHTDAASAERIRQSGQLISAGEPDVYVTTRATPDTGYGDTAVPIRVRPSDLAIDDEFPNGRRDYRLSVGKPGGSIYVAVGEYDNINSADALRQESMLASQQQAQAQGAQFNQPARGAFNPSKLTTIINQGADYSTFLHETAHFFLTVYADMATLPEATPQMQQDMQTILDFFGVKDIETWNAMSLEEQRKYHEAFAYNFEIYLFEGKSPSTGMQEMFNKFTRWLNQVYKSIRDELNALYRQENGTDLPILTDEIRSVMDRMVASEEQITQAEGVRNMRGMFQTQEQSGMDDATWAAYQKMLEEAHDEAVMDLTRASVRQVKWLNNARSRLIKEMQKEVETTRKETRAAVSEEVMNEPIYRLMEFIKRGLIDGKPSEFSGKLSIQEIEAMYGKGEMLDSIRKTFGYGKYGMLGKENGMHPEQVAEMFGYPSGYAMVQALLNVRPMKEEIDLRTDQRMMEENADMMDEKSINARVEEALHNEARARFIGAELRFLSKSTRPVRVMTTAAKQVAQQILGEKQINTIKPHEFTQAEARAAKAAEKASKDGDPRAAAKAKQNQLVQNQLSKEAVAMRQEVKKATEFFRKLFKADKTLSKSRNMDLVNAARSILAAYGLGKSDVPPAQYIEKIKAYDPDLYDQLEPLIINASSGGKPYQMMTMNEFRSMRDMVEALWFQSKREKQIMIEGQAMQLDQVVGELKARMDEIGIPETMPGETEAPTKRDFIARGLNTGKALLRRVEHWANATDGAAGTGAFTKYIWRPVRNAISEYRVQRNDFVKRYAELIGKLDLPAMKLTSKELGYTFGSANGGLGKAELLGALLHTGNPSNYRKLLLGGRGPGTAWGKENADGSLDTSRWDTFIDRMISEGILTKKDFDFLQAVWDLTEEMKPIAQKAHKDIFGYYFNEVEAAPVNTPFGVYRGGYVPAKVDPFLVGDATRNQKMEELEADFRQSMPSTGMGFTKSRVDYNKPLDLDIRKMTAHIDSVLRFAYIQPAIKDVLKILKNKEFSDTLNALDPGAIENMLLPWLNRAARQQTSVPGMYKGMDKFWMGVRNRTGISIMFANISNALQQVTGYFPALLLVNRTHMKSAMWDYMKRPHQVAEEVAAMSPFMADRMNNQIFDIQETLNDLLLNPSKYQKVAKWTQKHGYFLQQAFQNQVDVVVWTATYNQTLAEMDAKVGDKKAQKEAIAKADANVRMSQDSLAAEDIAAFQVGSPFYKTLIQFTGYFNMLANINADEYIKIFRDLGWKGNKGKLFMTYLLGFGLPMLMADAIVRTLGGEWDDEDDDGYVDEFAEWFFGSQLRGAVAMIPFGSSLLVPLNSLNDKPYDDRMSTSPSVSTLEAIAVGLPRTAINLVDEDKEVTGKNVRDVLTALSLATGIPFTVLGRPLGYAIDVERGVIDPSSEADYVRGIVTGKASEGTR